MGATLRGTYKILRTLDQGGMGVVFEAEHVRLRRRLAVKVLAQHLAKDALALARFNREAEIISQVQHPHVVHVADFDTTETGEPYLVMELLSGESLAARLEREGSLPLPDALRIAHQVASGLSAAHSASVVHRDLKPANIFLASVAGQESTVKLLDFGISKRTGAGKGLTGEYDVLGTPDYMAPEQALGKTASVDHRGDQYALAVITYEMLAGRTPFAGDDVMEVLRQVIGSEPPPLEELAPHVPREVVEVLARALSKEPRQRFASITELSSALFRAAGASLPPIEPLGMARTIPAAASEPRPSATAATLAAPPSSNELTLSLQRARQAHDLGDVELAVNHAEKALQVAETATSPRTSAELEGSSVLLNAIFEARLGPLSRRMVVLSPASNKKLRVSPEQAFLLSRLDGGITLDEAIDLSPLSRQKTLSLLVSMLRQGLIAAQ